MPINFAVGPTPSVANTSFSMFETRLAAINLCLRSCGYTKVETEDSSDLDAADAAETLNIVSQRVQYNGGKGWWFNLERKWKLTPDANGAVLIPNNVISVVQDPDYPDLYYHLTVRGRSLYDTVEHTFDLRHMVNKAGHIVLSFMVVLPFEHLPVSARQVIAYQAAAEFMTNKEFDSNKISLILQTASKLELELGLEQAGQAKLNMFVHNPTQSRFAGIVGGPNAVDNFSTGVWGTARPYRGKRNE